MVNLQRVRVHLRDLKLSDYPEMFNYDVKLIYLDLGHQPFPNGYITTTEKRSDAEPRFSAQPTLEVETSLRDMLVSTTTSGEPSLKLFFSVHRQVAREHTEEIGVGAMPIRLLFAKVAEGWMDMPTKFKVPLAAFRGVIRGKVLLRNIPQFSQLAGVDLVNVDGAIMPFDVDLTARKLLPWVKLPRDVERRLRAARDTGGDVARLSVHSPVTEEASEGGSECSSAPSGPHALRVRSKSGRSVASSGTADGTLDMGSLVMSGSEETHLARHARRNRSASAVDDGDDAVEEDMTVVGVAGSGAIDADTVAEEDEANAVTDLNDEDEVHEVDDDEEEEEEHDDGDWVAVHHPPSQQYYFVHRFTHESLWLPPDWARMEDEQGRPYFVDHAHRTTQRQFPADEARAYRESVTAG